MLLFGDSHAEQWFGPLNMYAKDHGWRLVSWTKVGCPLADVPFTNLQLGREYTECEQWRDERLAAIADLGPDLAVVSQADSLVPYDFGNDRWAEGTKQTLLSVAESSGRVVYLSDIPRSVGEDPTVCLATHLDDSSACTVPSDDGLPLADGSYAHLPTRHAAVRRALETVDLTMVNTQPWFCVGSKCPTVVGPTLVYRDDSHMTQFYARTLAPVLGQVLDNALEATP
jgi:hypothetical protein